MAHLTYEESKKRVMYGLKLLAAVTLVEVILSLLGKGYIIPGFEKYHVILYTTGFIIACLSLYKAYFIIYEFMHMKYEVKSMAMSVLLPTALLIWAVIAFFQEGSSWRNRRELIKEKNERPAQEKAPERMPQTSQPQGMLLSKDIYTPENWF